MKLVFFLALSLAATTNAQARFTVDHALDTVRVSAGALSPDGHWLMVTASTTRDRLGVDNHRYGDPTYVAPQAAELWVYDTTNGNGQRLLGEKRAVRGGAWSPDSEHLALFLAGRPVVWSREGGFREVQVPAGTEADTAAPLIWTSDGESMLFCVRPDRWCEEAQARFAALTRGPIVVLSSEEPFLAWEALRRRNSARRLCRWTAADGALEVFLEDGALTSYHVTDDGEHLVYSVDVSEKTDYGTTFGTLNDVHVRPLAGGDTKVVLTRRPGSSRGPRLLWSRDGRTFSYADKGKVHIGTVDTEARVLLGAKADEKEDEDSDGDEEKETFNPVRLSHDGAWLVASNKKGFWFVDTQSEERELFLPSGGDPKPRRQVLAWLPDASGVLVFEESRTEWRRAVLRCDRGAEPRRLFEGTDVYRGIRLSRDGSTAVLSAAAANRPADLWTTGADFAELRRLTEANPQLADDALAKAELVAYRDADGKESHGVLYYPCDYEEGQAYPTVFLVYEQFFDPRFSGFTNYLCAHGYAVMQPTVNFQTGYPGEAWLKGVTAAANVLIDRGIADPDRLGVQGTSYGGYATNLIIAQTPRFKAAVNVSGKVNMVSFYTDSPRLGVRNIHAPEKSQDRIGATLWEQPQKYVAHSAVMYADRIKTPLLLITGEQDHNVPARQAMEMYYALRRLGRTVTWVNYVHGGHGMPRTNAEEVRDYHERILAWYEKYLTVPEEKEGDQDAGIGTRGAGR